MPSQKTGFENVRFELLGYNFIELSLVEIQHMFYLYFDSLLRINNLDGTTINDGESCKNSKGTDKRRIKKEMWHYGRQIS